MYLKEFQLPLKYHSEQTKHVGPYLWYKVIPTFANGCIIAAPTPALQQT